MNGDKLDINRFDVQVIARLTRIEEKLESVPALWTKVNDHDKTLNKAKGAIGILSALWTLITVVVGRILWSHKW